MTKLWNRVVHSGYLVDIELAVQPHNFIRYAMVNMKIILPRQVASVTSHINRVIRTKLNFYYLAGAQCVGPEAHRSGRDVGQRQAAPHRAGRGHSLHRHHPLPAQAGGIVTSFCMFFIRM